MNEREVIWTGCRSERESFGSWWREIKQPRFLRARILTCFARQTSAYINSPFPLFLFFPISTHSAKVKGPSAKVRSRSQSERSTSSPPYVKAEYDGERRISFNRMGKDAITSPIGLELDGSPRVLENLSRPFCVQVSQPLL